MNKCTLVLTSVTYAYKAAGILAAEGMRAYPVKSPDVEKVRGCGYGVEVYGDRETALKILAQSGINVLGAVDERRRG
ncbi:MAG: DUF3343 domain-containing protein [Clostridia bacterium]|jgi:hypothetical protein|nr:DUF3343 domain-containing protein [Clostridia bacterium]MBO7549223.1 DUF3343 domain-containing protein [Clostridia bacterium]MBP5657310.1 DUF3343 domain-containing protein [Clostridia bacterium]